MTDAVKRFRPAYTKIARYETEPDMQEDADGNWVHVDDYRANARPMTVAEAAKVLVDCDYSVMAKAFDAMDKMQGEGADNVMAAALRALSQGGE